jgi:hypothetical protein
MTNAERREAERLYNALLVRVRRSSAGQSRAAVRAMNLLLDRVRRGLAEGSREELTRAGAARIMARVSKLLEQFEIDWAVTTRGVTRNILRGIVTEHRKVASIVADVVGVRQGGIAARIGTVPAKTERILRMTRKGKSIRTITKGHVEAINEGIAGYLERATGTMPSANAMRGIQRLLRGELPIDLGQSSKESLRMAASLPSKAERLIVTESFESYRQGQAIALGAGPVRMVAYWETADDEIVCPICIGIQNKDVGFGKGWYPPDQWPANPHPWCRCGQGEIRIVRE